MTAYTQYKPQLKAMCQKRGIMNIDKPVTIQEKINWMKIYDSTPLKTKCADKVLVHEYCKEKLGKDICIPILKVYDSPDDIVWNELPNKFVAKCNHGSGMNVIVKDKKSVSEKEVKEQLRVFMKDDFAFHVGYEMHYHNIPHKTFVETYMFDDKQKDSLYDYKFWCFNGVPKFYTINTGFGHGDILYYWMNGEAFDPYLKFVGKNTNTMFKKPTNFDLMVEYAKKLSADFKFVRVDFYEINGKVYLGELTFTPGAGFFKYEDKKYDKVIGDMLKL